MLPLVIAHTTATTQIALTKLEWAQISKVLNRKISTPPGFSCRSSYMLADHVGWPSHFTKVTKLVRLQWTQPFPSYLFSLLSYLRNFNTFSVWCLPTLTENVRSCLPWLPSKVVEDGSPILSWRKLTLTWTREPESAVKKRWIHHSNQV